MEVTESDFIFSRELNGEELLRKQHAKYSRIRRVQCLNGLFLEVLCDGKVRGTINDSTKYGTSIITTIRNSFLLKFEYRCVKTKKFINANDNK